VHGCEVLDRGFGIAISFGCYGGADVYVMGDAFALDGSYILVLYLYGGGVVRCLILLEVKVLVLVTIDRGVISSVYVDVFCRCADFDVTLVAIDVVVG
jgi:hypothetical protein